MVPGQSHIIRGRRCLITSGHVAQRTLLTTCTTPRTAQGLGLLATALYQEFGVPADRQGIVFSAMSAGLTAGAFFWGLAVDVIGRKWAFNMTVLITCVFVRVDRAGVLPSVHQA